MATPPPPERRSTGDKKTPPSSSIITRNGARKAKIQTRAMSAGAKPSAVVVAAKKKAQMKKKHQGDTLVRDYYQIAMDSKVKVKGPTGFVTEPRMAEHRCLWDTMYPECPERLTSVVERCTELKLLDQCVQFPPRAASKEEVTVLHSSSVYELLETTHQNEDLKYLEEVSSRYDAVYIHPTTHELSLIAAGSTIDMVDRIISGEVQNGFAAVRPPGHHAMYSEPCGYCFYNNAALAAKHAITKHGLSRILIVDWDVHHGQATQQMFYDDPRVVYFSIHRYEHGAFWPNLKQSNFHYTGSGDGEGYTFNVPLNSIGMKDADYLAIWHELLLPMAIEYQPELIIVSAGYDAAVGCPEFSPQLVVVSAGYDSAIGDEKGQMLVSPACYATLLYQLESVCAAVCVVLEGGYCVPSLAEGAALTLRTLLGHPPPQIDSIGEPSDSVRESILNCIYTHKKYWSCYNCLPTYSVNANVSNEGDVGRHTVVVKWEGDETVPDKYETRDCYPVQSEKEISEAMALLNRMKSKTDLSVPENAVSYIYDERMLKHKNICEPGHVESPDRILSVHQAHADYGLLDRVHQLPTREATAEEILTVHTNEYLEKLKKLANTTVKDLNTQRKAYNSVYLHPDSLESASVAAGNVLQMVDAVVNRRTGSGVCVVRPPGHHASKATPCGFCLLNNVGIAANYAVEKHGLQRVLILDWDVHHGNGTQEITYKSNKILYISIHRYDNGAFFPNSGDADYTAVGAGLGTGYNINIPWNKRRVGVTEYLMAMTKIVLPVAYEFNPQLVLVSAGFDAAVGDPLGGCKVTPECFGLMTKMVRGLASGRVILCLEGGYNITSLPYCMVMCTKALLGDPITQFYDPKPICHSSAIESINNVIKVHKKYWSSLKFHFALPIEDVIEKPSPSRGLMGSEDIVGDLLKLSVLSIDDSLSKDSNTSDQMEIFLEQEMANLSIATPKCEDGLHCGSDDETQDDLKKHPESKSHPQRGIMLENTEAKRDFDSAEPSAEHSGLSSKKVGPSSEKGEQSLHTAGSNSDKAGPSSEKSKQGRDEAGPSSKKSESLGGTGARSEMDKRDLDEAGPSSRDAGASSSASGSQRKDRKESDPSFDGPAVCRLRFERALRDSGDDPATLYQLLAQNMGSFIRGDMFAVVPQPWCPHIDELQAVPDDVQFKQGSKCTDCHRIIENWVCLHCYNVYCSRYANKHLQLHYSDTAHALALSLSDLSVWCSACEVYLHNERLYDVTNNAHRNKFGEDLPRRNVDNE